MWGHYTLIFNLSQVFFDGGGIRPLLGRADHSCRPVKAEPAALPNAAEDMSAEQAVKIEER
jgi:hypothetical protein